MSKQVRWQVPFAAQDGTQYRVDIYDEGYTGSPVQLTAGETPFTTDEDDSDDFFAPVRTQSGTLQICTETPSGSTIKLEDILPANNISRPVRLVNLSNSNAVEWQGFLSCEAYSQDYIGIPQNLDLPLIGVLEAMDSIEVELSESMAFKKILGHVAYAIKAIEDKSGMSLFDQMYISTYCKNALTTQYFYNNVYFSTEEQISGDNITVDVHSISAKAILEQVAKFFGCCWREKGQNIYLEALGTTSYSYHSFATIYNNFVVEPKTTVWLTAQGASADIDGLDWMGNGHQRSITQGMRRVKVTSKLDDFDCNMALEETPVNSLVENPEARQATNGEVYVNTNETFYSLAEHKHYLTKAIFPTDLSGASLQFVSTQSRINYSQTIFWKTNEFRQYYKELVVNQTKGSSSGINHYITSFMAWWRDKEGELRSGLMVCGVPQSLLYSYNPISGRSWSKYALTSSNYLFRQRTPLIFSASKGYLRLDVNTLAWSRADGKMPALVYGETMSPTLTMAVQFGNYWLYKTGNSYTWDTTFHTIDLPLERKTTDGELKTIGNWDESMGVDESEGIFIKIPNLITGVVSVYVYPYVNAICLDPYTNSMFDVFISKLDLEYVPLNEELRTDRSENVYATETSQAFRDELSVDCDLASYANNTKLATMLWNDSTTPAKLITLGGASVRPEVDLLNRLAAYYGAARQRLELEVAHITTPLPQLRLNGINDGKVYLPMAESRDWRKGVCKLTCIECPQ